LSGIEYISSLLDECDEFILDSSQPQNNSQNNNNDYEKVTKTFSSIDRLRTIVCSMRTTLKNMRNVKKFMLMTINRCIDYTKASNGLKLTPHNEYFKLSETLDTALACVNDMQDQSKINLKPLSGTVATEFLFSDKQWLVENLMCLFANAVKYSHKNVVDVEITLVSAANKTVELIVDNNAFSFEQNIDVSKEKNNSISVLKQDNLKESNVKVLENLYKNGEDNFNSDNYNSKKTALKKNISISCEEVELECQQLQLQQQQKLSSSSSTTTTWFLKFEVHDKGDNIENPIDLFQPSKQHA
jgi:hypothetical protein